MKRSILAFLLLLCLGMTACGGGNESQADYTGKEAQNKYARAWGLLSFQETEEYYIGNDLIGNKAYYYDKVNGISGLLCADPACTHEDSSCCAHVRRGATLFLHGGQRYWITDDHADGGDHILWRSDLSGENRVKLKTISLQDIVMIYQPQQYFLHREHIYFLGTEDVLPVGTRISIMGSALDNEDSFTPLFDETYDLSANAEACFVGSYAYLMVTQFEGVDNWDNIYVSIYRIHLTTGEQELLYEEADLHAPADSLWVTEDGTVCFVKNNRLCVLEDGNVRQILLTDNPDVYPWVMDGIVLISTAKETTLWFTVLDFEGNTLYDGPAFTNVVPGPETIPQIGRGFSWAVVGGDRDKLILAMEEADWKDNNGFGYAMNSKAYMLALDLSNNLAPTLLWMSES